MPREALPVVDFHCVPFQTGQEGKAEKEDKRRG